jgi:hypothetical protein
MARLDKPENDATPEQISALKDAGFTETEIQLFTPDEREALLDTENDGAIEGAVHRGVEGDEGAADEDKAGRGYPDLVDSDAMPHEAEEVEAQPTKEEKEAEEEPVAAKKDEPEAEAKAEAEPEPDIKDRREFVPKMRVVELRDWKAERKAVRAPLEDARKKWGEGDITNEQFHAISDEIQDKLDALTVAETEARVAAQFNADAQGSMWEKVQADFMDENPDWTYAKNPLRYEALSSCLKINAETWTKAGYSDYKCIRLAKAEVEKAFGLPAKVEPESKAEPTPKATPRAKPDLKSVPTTLAHVPAAADIETGSDSEFDMLDKLDGLALEQAIARLPEYKQEEYLKRA